MLIKYVLFTLVKIELISSKKYWRVPKNLLLVLKEVIQVKFSFHKVLTKIDTIEERFNFLKT